MRVGVVVIHAILEMQTISIAIDPLVCFRAAFDFQPPYTHHSNPVRFAKLDEKSKHLQPDQYGLFLAPSNAFQLPRAPVVRGQGVLHAIPSLKISETTLRSHMSQQLPHDSATCRPDKTIWPSRSPVVKA